MKTYRLSENVTLTLTNGTARLYEQYLAAEENLGRAYHNENLDWEDLEDIQVEVWEAWERFIS